MHVRIVDNDKPSHPGQTLIECVNDGGRVLWRSWAPDELDPAVRLSPTEFPVVADERSTTDTTEIAYRVPTVAEFESFAGDSREEHRVLATLAVTAGAVSLADAAQAAQVTQKALVNEALGWAAARP